MTKKKTPAEYTTPWHAFAGIIVPDAAVFQVGENTKKIDHYCPKAPQPKIIPIELVQPIHVAVPSGYCRACKILFVGEDPE